MYTPAFGSLKTKYESMTQKCIVFLNVSFSASCWNTLYPLASMLLQDFNLFLFNTNSKCEALVNLNLAPFICSTSSSI